MYDTLGTLLYVGITQQQSRRFDQHNQDKPWWSEVASITVEHFPNRRAVQIAEMAAIAAEHPKYNIIGNGCGTFPTWLPHEVRISLAILHGHSDLRRVVKCAGGSRRATEMTLSAMILAGDLDAERVGRAVRVRFTDEHRVLRRCQDCGGALRIAAAVRCKKCAELRLLGVGR
jgi:hypothetical protein